MWKFHFRGTGYIFRFHVMPAYFQICYVGFHFTSMQKNFRKKHIDFPKCNLPDSIFYSNLLKNDTKNRPERLQILNNILLFYYELVGSSRSSRKALDAATKSTKPLFSSN